MKQVVIINGSGGVGKDTFVEFCSKYTNVANISSVDNVKEAAKILTGWNGEKDEKSRKLLSDLKKLGIEYNDAPFQYLSKKVQEFQNSDKEMLFIHIREHTEIEKCKQAFLAKTLLITNKNVAAILSNYSDSDINNYHYDYVIHNDGTLEELKQKAKNFLKNF